MSDSVFVQVYRNLRGEPEYLEDGSKSDVPVIDINLVVLFDDAYTCLKCGARNQFCAGVCVTCKDENMICAKIVLPNTNTE